jgi:hypothetical protein
MQWMDKMQFLIDLISTFIMAQCVITARHSVLLTT